MVSTNRKMSDPDRDNDNPASPGDDTIPLLLASPLPYGTPETVIFDEAASPIIIPARAEFIGPVTSDGPHENDHPLAIPASGSADLSAAQSDKSEMPSFQDAPFAVLFWIQLIAVLLLGYNIAPQGYDMLDFQEIDKMMREDPDTKSSDLEAFETFVTYAAQYAQVYPQRIVLCLFAPTGVMAFLTAMIVTTTIIRPFPKCMVTFCILGYFVDTAIFLTILVIGSKSIGFLIFSILILSVVAYYVRAAWRLIPYSAVNLGVSLQGVQSNWGIYIVAMFLAKLGFFFSIYFFYTMIGVMIYVGETQCPGMDEDDDCGPQGLAFLFFMLSFYWTIQVIINTIQVTVAGVMATWCFDFDYARGCCSSAVWSSLYRSLTFSFGSICFGSLLMGVVRILRYFIRNAKKQRDAQSDNCEGAGMVLCVLDCLIKVFEEVLEYFNHWSFVFCGVYGSSYLQSGRMVIELFRARGWETFISDDLIGYVLAFTTFSVGIASGLCSVGLELIIDSHFEPDPVDAEKLSNPDLLEPWDINKSFLFGPFPHPTFLAFGLGFLFGIIVCSIMMSVVRGAVNTLIVCWADSPSRLEANHPEATKEMAETWSAVFPAARVNLSSAMSFPVGSPVETARNS